MAAKIYREERAITRQAIAEARAIKDQQVALAKTIREQNRQAKLAERATREMLRAERQALSARKRIERQHRAAERRRRIIEKMAEVDASGVCIHISLEKPLRFGVRRHRARGVLFQPYQFRFHAAPSPSKAIKEHLSLDAPFAHSNDKRFGNGTSLADVVPDSAPNILERMLESEGVERVVQRLSDERNIPVSQARQIVDALVDSDMLEDESVFNLADTLRGAWQANALLTKIEQYNPRFERPRESNPEPAQYEHWRRKYGLARSGRVITRDVETERFGGAWSVETALPEEAREEQAA